MFGKTLIKFFRTTKSLGGIHTGNHYFTRPKATYQKNFTLFIVTERKVLKHYPNGVRVDHVFR